MFRVKKVCIGLVVLIFACSLSGCGGLSVGEYVVPDAISGGDIVMQAAAGQDADPFAAGRAAAQALKDKMGSTAPHAVVIAECFEDRAAKNRALKGVCSVFPRRIVFGFATYGSFSQAGCLDVDSVGLLGIGGDGISVAAAIRENLGIAGLTMEANESELQSRLRTGGAELAGGVVRRKDDRLLVVMADAHSPKNQFLVEGAQRVVGRKFPITGGSANKNAGQTYVYYQGRMFTDSAIALMLSGDFEVSQSGRQAKDNAKVISSAADGAAAAMAGSTAKPFGVLAYNCAGRKGKLDNLSDELAAIQSEIGKTIPLFGCYCAGEIGPADTAEKNAGVLSSGMGWHVMFTVLAR
jgi:hypothetical protein